MNNYLKTFLSMYGDLINLHLNQYIDKLKKNHSSIMDIGADLMIDSVKYSLLSKGKRLRPILLIAAYDTIVNNIPNLNDEIVEHPAIKAACAMEMIHTYSLIHDDLPAMDNDDLRRGKPTNHKVFGEAAAILAGDTLLTDAFFMMSSMNTNPATVLECIKKVAFSSGSSGMVCGQILDMNRNSIKATENYLKEVYSKKTGALISASVECGSILGKNKPGDNKKLSFLKEYGEKIGLAFQLRDDLIDCLDYEIDTGKGKGRDISRGIKTFPDIVGKDKTTKIITELVNNAINCLSEFGDEANTLRLIAEYINKREY